MNDAIRILFMGNQQESKHDLLDNLNKCDYKIFIQKVVSINDAVVAFGMQSWDIVLLRLDCMGCTEVESLSSIVNFVANIPVIIISDNPDEFLIKSARAAGIRSFISTDTISNIIPVIATVLSGSYACFRKRAAEIEDSRSEEKYRQLAESISDVFFALDMNLCCTYWNRAAEKLTGIAVKSALTQPFLNLFPEDPGREIEESLMYVIKNKEPGAMVFSWDMQGTIKHFELNVYPTDSGVSVLARDISFRKKIDVFQKSQEEITSQLAQAQELRILGQLTSGVAHEVRNPLNAISVVLEALFQDLGDLPEYRLYREHLFTHVDRLKRLMQDLLQLGRPIERSKVTTFDIEDLVRETVELWKTSGPHYHFNIDIQSIGETDLRVKGDPLKLQQVFMNLLENASQHSIIEKCIMITLTGFEDSCEIKITDRGNGIKPDHLSKIFDPFFTTRKKGTGLGLSIVKHIVDVHGGAITIENNKQVSGCTVNVLLPRVQRLKKSLQKDTTEIERGCIQSFNF